MPRLSNDALLAFARGLVGVSISDVPDMARELIAARKCIQHLRWQTDAHATACKCPTCTLLVRYNEACK